MIHRWIDENPPGKGPGWEPCPLSRRIVNWSKWILCGHTATDEMAHSMCVQTRWLVPMIHPDGEIALFNDSAFGVVPTLDEFK